MVIKLLKVSGIEPRLSCYESNFHITQAMAPITAGSEPYDNTTAALTTNAALLEVLFTTLYHHFDKVNTWHWIKSLAKADRSVECLECFQSHRQMQFRIG